MKGKLPAITPMKIVTPAVLLKTDSPASRNVQSPEEVSSSSKFLTSRQHRLFPVSLNSSQLVETHDPHLHQDSAVRRSFDEGAVRLPAVKRSRPRNSSTETKASEEREAIKLPELRMRQVLEDSEISRRQHNEDNSNKTLTRSPGRVFAEPQKKRQARMPALRPEPSQPLDTSRDSPDPEVNYETLALSYAQKLQRIKKLADSTMKMLQV